MANIEKTPRISGAELFSIPCTKVFLAIAEKYAKAALHHMVNERELCQTFEDLSRQELSHSDKLHAQAVRLINAKKSAGIAAPASMEAIWSWEHGKMIEKTAHVHRLLDMLKG